MKLKIDEFENYAKRNGVSPRLMLQKLGGGRLAYKHLKTVVRSVTSLQKKCTMRWASGLFFRL